ncbi:hypothetical protein ACF3OC_07895 [Sphingobacterium cellulitidis]|uniref:hypothetical protein n=1 Tax=Sphingobacterium cellulitidis TaxID=1768011 RepID=UPI00370DCE9F
MRNEGIVQVGIFVFLAAAAATILILELSTNMYNLTFENKGKEITVQVNSDGLIQRATEEEPKWKERVVIGVGKLKEGETVRMYNLFSDALIPESENYRVIQVRHDTGIF